MEKSPQYKPLFPEGLDHLNKNYDRLQQRLNAIDYELENALRDEGPVPRLRPAGPEGYNTSMRADRKEFLERTREKYVQRSREGLKQAITGLDEKTQSEILGRFDYETSKNQFKSYAKENLKEIQDNKKRDEVSTDYMAAKHFSRYNKPDKSIAGEKENIDAWSDRYVNLLDSYRNNMDDRDFRPEIDDPEPDKD